MEIAFYLSSILLVLVFAHSIYKYRYSIVLHWQFLFGLPYVLIILVPSVISNDDLLREYLPKDAFNAYMIVVSIFNFLISLLLVSVFLGKKNRKIAVFICEKRFSDILAIQKLGVLLFYIGIICYGIWVYSAGGLRFLVSVEHGVVGEVTSGFVYQAKQWVFLSVGCFSWLYFNNKLRKTHAFYLFVALGLFFVEFYFFGNRGTTIRVVSSIIVAYLMSAGTLSLRHMLLMAFSAVSVLLLPYVRKFTYLDYQGESLSLQLLLDTFTLGSTNSTGNEHLILAAISAMYISGDLPFSNFGRYLYAFIMMVPSFIFEMLGLEKITYQDYGFNVGDAIYSNFGWQIGGGAAVTGVGDLLTSVTLFPFFFIILFAFLHFFKPKTYWIQFYFSYLFFCSSIYFWAQDFKQFIWYLIIGLLPILLVKLIWKFND